MKPNTPVWNHIVAEHPRFSTAVFPTKNSRRISVEELASVEVLDRAIAASDELFPMGVPKHQAQVWWFSLNNTLLGPALTAMVECHVTPSLDVARGAMFIQNPGTEHGQGYWMSFFTDVFTDDSEAAWRAAGADYARSIAPVLQALAEVAGASTRALWAVSVDAVAGAAVGAGNDAFEPYRGVRIAQALLAGMAEGVPEGVRLPQPHFRDFCDGHFQPTDVAAALAGEERDVHTVPQRVSCCMIYRSPAAGMCLSCPKQTPEERDRQLIDSFTFDF